MLLLVGMEHRLAGGQRGLLGPMSCAEAAEMLLTHRITQQHFPRALCSENQGNGIAKPLCSPQHQAAIKLLCLHWMGLVWLLLSLRFQLSSASAQEDSVSLCQVIYITLLFSNFLSKS